MKALSRQLNANESGVHEIELSWKYKFEYHQHIGGIESLKLDEVI